MSKKELIPIFRTINDTAKTGQNNEDPQNIRYCFGFIRPLCGNLHKCL